MDELLRDFLDETVKMLEGVHPGSGQAAAGAAGGQEFAGLLRLLHTVKGTCGFLGLQRLEALAHAGEDLAGRCAHETPPPQARALVGQAVQRIETLIQEIAAAGAEPAGSDDDLIFHLTAVADRPWAKAPMERAPARAPQPKPETEPASRSPRPGLDLLERIASDLAAGCDQLEAASQSLAGGRWAAPMAELLTALRELQSSTSASRQRPIRLAWRNIPAIVSDLSKRLGKPIVLEVHGGAIPIDEAMLGTLNQALVHMVRNCADHGLESPDERAAANKDRIGRIAIRAQAEEGQVSVEIADDGRGLDTPNIAAAALRSGLVSGAEVLTMDPHRIHQLIFEAGLSTAPEITSVSGRGIGMDVVRANIAQLGGRLAIGSAAGAGTRITITLPQIMTVWPPAPRAAAAEGLAPQAQAPKRIAA